jgi:hypothetical protein
LVTPRAERRRGGIFGGHEAAHTRPESGSDRYADSVSMSRWKSGQFSPAHAELDLLLLELASQLLFADPLDPIVVVGVTQPATGRFMLFADDSSEPGGS